MIQQKSDKILASVPGILIAAPFSGSGKTTFTTGLLAALKKRTRSLYSYKCGPDYIDPMYHTRVLGIPCRNLDTWFTGEEKLKELFLHDPAEAFHVVEGVMGLYDGVAGIRPEGSSYDLARVLGLPILLVVSAKGMGSSVIALIRGFLEQDRFGLIRGIFLNQISEEMYRRLKPELEKKLRVPCLGFLPGDKQLQVPGRYLGLAQPGDFAGHEAYIRHSGDAVEQALDWEKFYHIARWNALRNEERWEEEGAEPGPAEDKADEDPPREFSGCSVAVARDPAFSFLYEDNLRELRELGIKILFFSPLSDAELPPGINGLYLPGGYPELYAERLSENHSMLRDIREKIKKGLPTVAECGGFLYLQLKLFTPEGEGFPMAGVLPGEARKKERLVRFGYVEIEEERPTFLPEGLRLKGHEFHYYDSTENGASCTMTKPVTGRAWKGIVATETLWAGFPHIYFPAEPGFVRAWAEKMRQHERRSKV